MPSFTAEQLAANIDPNYEVKLLMNSDLVLDSDNTLSSAVLDAFKIIKAPKKMALQFLDTANRDLHNAGWSLRVRKMQGKHGIGLNYKNRYTIVDGDVEMSSAIAAQDGFDSSGPFKGQVDWGFRRMTLSIYRDEPQKDEHEDDNDDSEVNADSLPDVMVSREMLSTMAPDAFTSPIDENAGWGTEKIDASRIYGPIFALRYTGTWKGEDLDVEVWPIKKDPSRGEGMEFIVEASFKVKRFAKADKMHNELIGVLKGKNWLLPEDTLKQSLIMQRY